MKFGFLTAICCFASTCLVRAGAVPEAAVMTSHPKPWDFSLTLDSAFRRDDFNWTIAGDSNGQNPNVLSELDWTKLNIISTGGAAEFTVHDHWHLRFGGSYGWIISGNNRDSDYLFDDRQGEFSRSRADTRGEVIDAEAMIGYDFKMMRGRMTLTPWLGFSFHKQELNDRCGVQEIDLLSGDLGAFPGLDSKYEADWYGAVFGLEAKVNLFTNWRLTGGVRYELQSYTAHADWNLRSDLDGFSHTAKGSAWLLHTGVEWDFQPGWTLALSGFFGVATAGHGTDDTTFSGGSHIATRLNEVRWRTVGVQTALTYRF